MTWWDAFCAAKDAGDFLSAELIADEAIRRHEGDARAWAALANINSRLGDFKQAITAGEKALCLAPSDMDVVYALGLEYLRAGRFGIGWAFYSARNARLQGWIDGDKPPMSDCKRVWLDQGVGDQIMFASVIPDLEPGKHTYLCDPRLVPIFQRSFPGEKFEGVVGTPALWDCTMAFLAQEIRQSFDQFPTRGSYLLAKRMGERPVVGAGYSYRSYGTKDEAYKSIPETLLLAADWGNVAVADLQYTPHDVFWDNPDTLAQNIVMCKCVVTTSNVTAHMAGALGVPTLVMIPKGFGQMWHWFLECTDSPWYPNVEIVRQTTRGDWTPCLERARSFVQEHQ